jgi:hypothetical protein
MPSSDRKTQKEAVSVTLHLVPDTDEYRMYNRIKRKYLREMAKRQSDASDDEPCDTQLGHSELVRAALIALDRVDEKELPEVIHAARKKKGRPEIADTTTPTPVELRKGARPATVPRRLLSKISS